MQHYMELLLSYFRHYHTITLCFLLLPFILLNLFPPRQWTSGAVYLHASKSSSLELKSTTFVVTLGSWFDTMLL